jgi:hypothetical protein
MRYFAKDCITVIQTTKKEIALSIRTFFYVKRINKSVVIANQRTKANMYSLWLLKIQA